MRIELKERTEQHVRIYFERTQDSEIQRYLPQTVFSVEQALANYAHTQRSNPSSYGAAIYVDGTYVGDVWCYGINLTENPQAMVSYCIFEKAYWRKGIMSRALALFLANIKARFGIAYIGAFAYAANTASIRVLEKNDFVLIESFQEDGVDSVYFQTGDCHVAADGSSQ